MPVPAITVAPRCEHVLICTDGSAPGTAAAAGATLVAGRTGAALHVVHVQEGNAAHDRELATELGAQAAALGASADILTPEWGEESQVARALARHIESLPNALACVSAHGRSGIGQSLLGSVTSDLLRTTDRPLLVFGPNAAVPTELSRVLACTDSSDLAEAIMPAAAGLARDVGVPLWLVEVVDPKRGAPAGGDVVEASTIQRLAGRIAAEGGPAGVDVSWDVLHGDHPGPVIAAYADAEPGTVTALATHGRGGLAGTLMGSVAQHLIRRSEGPILLMRPAATERR